MEIRYVGPFDQVEIADTGQTVAQGDTVSVDDSLAERLLAQTDNWQAAKPAKTKAVEAAGNQEL